MRAAGPDAANRMATQSIESAVREVKIWRYLRETETVLQELRDLRAFVKGYEFAGKRLPFTMQDKSIDYIELLLTADLVRLRKQSNV